MDPGDQGYPWDLVVLVIQVVHSVQVAPGLQANPGSLLVLKVQEYLVSQAHPSLLLIPGTLDLLVQEVLEGQVLLYYPFLLQGQEDLADLACHHHL